MTAAQQTLTTDTDAAITFLKGVFAATTHQVYLCSLPNERDDPAQAGMQQCISRAGATVAPWFLKWNRLGRGMFFAISTIRPGATRRAKDTVSELAILHVDVDFKSVTPSEADVLRAIEGLPHRPSIIVRSGHGLHLYWLLKEAIDVSDPAEVARAEAALRQLADLVGGDLAVCEVARLMRLPGTHNSKDGTARPVTIERADYEAFHLLEDIEEMLSYMSPVISRREQKSGLGLALAGCASNPFLAAAARMGFKPPLDVETRLRAMSYQGAGDACIHQTQVSVSAALLNRGVGIVDVIATVMDATRAAAGSYGENWNWPREERAVRRMCEDWVRKNPVQKPMKPELGVMLSAGAGSTKTEQDQHSKSDSLRTGNAAVAVVKLDDHRPPPKAKTKRAALDKPPPPHSVLAATMIEVAQAENRPFLAVSEATGDRQLWCYTDGLWSKTASIDVEIEVAARSLGIPTSMKLRSETMAAIKADPDVVRTAAAVPWDGHGLIPAANGLVDVETLQAQPYTPEHLATSRLPHDFVADAECPVWRRAIDTFFRDKEPADRAMYVALIQEVAGAGLLATKPRALSRALVLYGLQNAGKSQILNVLTGLYGKSPIAQPLKSLEGEHGTVPFARHAPWVLHEAFNQKEWILSDKVKQIITGEPIQINFKFGAQFEHVFRAPIIWATNHPPAFREGSRAMISRMLVVPCKGDFNDDDPVDVAAEAVAAGFLSVSAYVLDREGPGILKWAVEGLRRVLARGRFDPPAEMASIANEIFTDSNHVAEFVRDCCAFDPRKMVRIPDLMAAFAVWFGEQRGEDLRVPSANLVSRMMKALPEAALICADREVFRKNSARFYGGIVLNDEGMDYWRGVSSSRAADGRSSRISDKEVLVNQIIPKDWIRDSVEARSMIRAHERRDAAQRKPSDSKPRDGPNGSDRTGDQLGDQSGDRSRAHDDRSPLF